MDSEYDLLRKFQRIEKLFTGATTEGERDAAADALERIKQRLAELQQSDPEREYKFTLSNSWSRMLLSALLRRYGIKPYRYARQRYTTVMAMVPKSFVDNILWPEFQQLEKVLTDHVDAITANIISKAVSKDISEVSIESHSTESQKLLG